MAKTCFRKYQRTNTSFEEIFAGEYDLDLKTAPVTVLDLGANEGAFTAWALERWPDCKITAFEPMAVNAGLFMENHGQNPRVTFRSAAVTMHPGDTVPMHPGLRNSGGCSIYDLGEQCQETMLASTLHPELLPAADFVKVDTEGCELEILGNMDLTRTQAIVCEWHRDDDAGPIIGLLTAAGFQMVHAERWWTNRGILKFARPGTLHNRVKTVRREDSPEPGAKSADHDISSGTDIFIPDTMNFAGNTPDGKMISLRAGHLRYPHYRPGLAGKKLFIGVPVYSTAATVFVQCLLALQAQKPLPIEVHFGMGDGVARTRNSLTAMFLKSDCTHLLFIDCDLIFSADDIARLLEADQPVIGGFYPKKQQGQLEWVINTLPDMPKVRPDKLQAVKYAGTGFICIRRDVFVKMAEAFPELSFRQDFEPRDIAWDFWSMGPYRNADGTAIVCTRKLLDYLEKQDGAKETDLIARLETLLARLPENDEGRYLSEDWYFCQRWLDLGGEVLMHTKVMVRHFGSAIYPLDTQMAEVSNPVKRPAGKAQANSDAATPPAAVPAPATDARRLDEFSSQKSRATVPATETKSLP